MIGKDNRIASFVNNFIAAVAIPICVTDDIMDVDEDIELVDEDLMDYECREQQQHLNIFQDRPYPLSSAGPPSCPFSPGGQQSSCPWGSSNQPDFGENLIDFDIELPCPRPSQPCPRNQQPSGPYSSELNDIFG